MSAIFYAILTGILRASCVLTRILTKFSVLSQRQLVCNSNKIIQFSTNRSRRKATSLTKSTALCRYVPLPVLRFSTNMFASAGRLASETIMNLLQSRRATVLCNVSAGSNCCTYTCISNQLPISDSCNLSVSTQFEYLPESMQLQ